MAVQRQTETHDAGEEAGDTFADRLNKLFASVRRADGSEYSLREVADAITADGAPISYNYIAQLRHGEKDNPDLRRLRGLARFFGVPVEYFTSDNLARQIDRELDLLAALQQLRVRTVALRESVLPQAEQGVAALTELIDRIRALEKQHSQPEG